MSNEIKKISKMIDEVSTYLLHLYDKPFSIDVQPTRSHFKVTFIVKEISKEESNLENLKKMLSAPKNIELEDYYWQLAGEVETPHELYLVSMMSDSSSISHVNSELSITFIRDRELL